MQKYVPLVKQNVMKLEVFNLERQRIDQKRKKGWDGGEGEERIKKGSRDRIEIENRHLPLLVVQFPQGIAFILSS